MHRPDALDVLRIALLVAVTGAAPACVTIPPNTTPKQEDSATHTGDTSSVDVCNGGASTPILDENGVATGFERCDDGTTHRVSVVAVDATISGESCAGTETNRSCDVDAQCTAAAHGRCITEAWSDTGSSTNCGCVYSCAADSECAAGQVCLPTGVVETGRAYSTCVAATCTTDSDCDRGECGVSSYNTGCGWDTQLACRDNPDVCRVDADCQPGDEYCAVQNEKWTCLSSDCAIGRPLLVDDAPRVAVSVSSDGWQEAGAAVRLPAHPETRAALTRYWLQIAALEHASVGSFARFTLQLLALGAPSELLADTQRAALDEIRHARFAYGLASAYAGAPVGPGPLDLTGAAPALDAQSIVAALITEACIGETLGAAEAAAAADACADPTLAKALRGIADDEARHAALAWRSLRWILTEHSPHLARFAREQIREAVAFLSTTANPLSPEAVSTGESLAEYGVLSAAQRAALHRSTLSRVVSPLVDSLFSGVAAFSH